MLKGLKNAWLSPIGQLVVDTGEDYEELCDIAAWHLRVALHIIKKMKKYKHAKDWFEYSDEIDPCEYLYDRKWVKLHTFPGSDIEPVWIVEFNSRITKAQEGAILDWCIVNNRKYDTCFY